MKVSVRAGAYLLAVLLFATVVMTGQGISQGSEVLYGPEMIGVEVLLNGPGTELDEAVLMDLIADGMVKLPAHNGTQQGKEPLLGLVPGPYLMRSSYDNGLGVIVSPEDQTEFLQSQGIDNPMKGVSVSIVLPGSIVLIKETFTQYEVYLNRSVSMDRDLVEALLAIGLGDPNPSDGSDPDNLELRYGPSKVTLSNTTIGFDETERSVLSIRVEVKEGDLTQGLEDIIRQVLDLLGEPPSLWETASESSFEMLVPMVRTHRGLDPTSVDWMEAMRSELEHLVSIGLVSGLSNDDIDGISELTAIGSIGFKDRLFYHYGTGNWTNYRTTGYPAPLVLPGESGHIYSDEMFPIVPERPSPNIMPYILAIGASIIIVLVLGTFIFQRFDRASKLNNARRLLIYNTIKQSPGIHFSALMKDLGLKPGVTSYHINRMEKEELIKSFQDGMYRRFYLYEEKVETKLMLSDLQKLILETIKAEPGISQMGISKVVGRSKVVINYHIRFLRDLGVLTVEAEGRETHCFLTSQGLMLSAS